MSFVWWILVGLIAGWATGKIMKGSGYGVLMDIGLGIVGAIVGGMLLGVLGISTPGGLLPTILLAILGAVVVVVVVRLLRRV
jgi:Predicted membrane protein